MDPPHLREVEELTVGDRVRRTDGPLGTWTSIEDIHVYFFEEEPLVALPAEEKTTVAVTRWHQVRQDGTHMYVPANQVSTGSLVPPAPRLVFDLVTRGNLPIRCS